MSELLKTACYISLIILTILFYYTLLYKLFATLNTNI